MVIWFGGHMKKIAFLFAAHSSGAGKFPHLHDHLHKDEAASGHTTVTCGV